MEEITNREEESVRRRTALFNQYVVPHVNLVYKLCIKYSFSFSDVQDNYNELLINFYKYIETYDSARPIQTWLHIVTKRFVNEMNRRNSVFKISEDVKVSDLQSSMTTDDSDISENSMGIHNWRGLYSDHVLNALDSMKPIYRDALLLQQAGYKLEEIMEITFANGTLRCKNIETVKSRLHLAKKQMRKLIDKNGERRKD